MIAIVAIVIFFYLIAVLSKRSDEDALVDIDFSKIDEMEGHRFEYFIAKVLRENGFKNVNVTKASGDYGVDITANKDNQKWAFQCKRYSSNLGLKPIQEIYAGAKKYGADKAVVFTNVYFTPNAQTLAKTLNVRISLLACTILSGCSGLVHSKSIKKKETQRLVLVHILNTLVFSTIMNIVSLSM